MSIIDFHNHVIPGVDDGASTDEEAAGALRAFLDADTHSIVATPHVAGSLTRRAPDITARLAEIDAGWARLESIAREHAPDMKIHRGAEVMLDSPDPDLSDPRLRLAGTQFVLCEYPFMTVPPNSAGVVHRIVAAGFVPIIAHPERYVGVESDCILPRRWKSAGALLQVNAGSITGRYGERARFNVYALLELGLADYVCSDFHSRGHPSTANAVRLLTEAGGAEQQELLMKVNPARMLRGEPPVTVPPLQLKLSVSQRLRRWLR